MPIADRATRAGLLHCATQSQRDAEALQLIFDCSCEQQYLPAITTPRIGQNSRCASSPAPGEVSHRKRPLAGSQGVPEGGCYILRCLAWQIQPGLGVDQRAVACTVANEDGAYGLARVP